MTGENGNVAYSSKCALDHMLTTMSTGQIDNSLIIGHCCVCVITNWPLSDQRKGDALANEVSLTTRTRELEISHMRVKSESQQMHRSDECAHICHTCPIEENMSWHVFFSLRSLLFAVDEPFSWISLVSTVSREAFDPNPNQRLNSICWIVAWWNCQVNNACPFR